MQIHTLPSITKRKSKRLGQGHGGGRGKTSGRGTKGQKARGKIPLTFEGGALPITRRLPFLRGKERNKSLRHKPVIINVKALNYLQKNTVIDIKTLVTNHLVKEKEAITYGVKILGDGKLTIPLTVTLPVSRGAKRKIEEAGGRIVLE